MNAVGYLSVDKTMFLWLYCEPVSTLTVNNTCILGRGLVVVSCNQSSACGQMLFVADLQWSLSVISVFPVFLPSMFLGHNHQVLVSLCYLICLQPEAWIELGSVLLYYLASSCSSFGLAVPTSCLFRSLCIVENFILSCRGLSRMPPWGLCNGDVLRGSSSFSAEKTSIWCYFSTYTMRVTCFKE